MLRIAPSSARAAARRMMSSAADAPAGCFLPVADVTNRVVNVVSSFKSSPAHISPHSGFVSDLGFDSLMVKDLIGNLGEEFCVEIPAAAASGFYGVSDAVAFFASHPKAR